MNQHLKTGLLLQIPNIIILTIMIIFWALPYLSLELISWIFLGTVYVLINIASLILIIIGVLSK